MSCVWQRIIGIVAIIVCVGACASACSAPWSGKTQAGKPSTSGEPSASQSNADMDFGEDSGHLASSLQALAKRMLNDDNTLKKEKKDSDDVMSAQQRDIIVRATKNNGKISRPDYEQSWMNFRSCIVNRGWNDPKPLSYGGFYSMPAMNYAGLTDSQSKKLDKDLSYCIGHEMMNVDLLYRTQEGNAELSTDYHQLIVDCLIKKNVVPTSYSKDQFSKDTSSDSAPEFFHSAEAQECFALYQYGYAEASDQASHWKPLG